MNFQENLSRMWLSSLHVIWYSTPIQKHSDNLEFWGKTWHDIPFLVTKLHYNYRILQLSVYYLFIDTLHPAWKGHVTPYHSFKRETGVNIGTLASKPGPTNVHDVLMTVTQCANIEVFCIWKKKLHILWYQEN